MQAMAKKHKKRLKRQSRVALARRKPRAATVAPCPWDLGPTTAAQQAGKITEEATYTDPETGEKLNPNGVKRARRIDVAEFYFNKGYISESGWKAARAIREAWEATMQSQPAIKKVQVDSSPKPDAAVVIQVDRLSKLASVSKHIPPGYRGMIEHVVMSNQSAWSYHRITKRKHLSVIERRELAKKALRIMLDEVAKRMGV